MKRSEKREGKCLYKHGVFFLCLLLFFASNKMGWKRIRERGGSMEVLFLIGCSVASHLQQQAPPPSSPPKKRWFFLTFCTDGWFGGEGGSGEACAKKKRTGQAFVWVYGQRWRKLVHFLQSPKVLFSIVCSIHVLGTKTDPIARYVIRTQRHVRMHALSFLGKLARERSAGYLQPFLEF